MSVWSRGMIPALGAGGPGFDSRNGPGYPFVSPFPAFFFAQEDTPVLGNTPKMSGGRNFAQKRPEMARNGSELKCSQPTVQFSHFRRHYANTTECK